MIDYGTLLGDLRTMSTAQVTSIRDQAREVVYGLHTTIAALSQSATFDREDAAQILRAANEVLNPEEDGISRKGTYAHFQRSGFPLNAP